MTRIKVLHLLNTIEPSGVGNLLHAQIPYYNHKEMDIYIGYLTGTSILFQDMKNITLVDFSSTTKFTFLSIFHIFRFTRSHKIDIIHTHLIQASLLGRFLSFILPSVKCVTTRHYAKAKKHKRLINKLEDYTERYSDAIICISNYVRTYLLNLGINKSKLYVMYNAVDLKIFDKYTLKNESEMIIGTVGRLDKQKGIDVLINAHAQLVRKFPNLILEIIGDGPHREKLSLLTRELKLENNVRFLGNIPPVLVREKMVRWKIFILASRWEAFGIVNIEALALGLPVIASNVEAIPEVILEGVTGYLIQPDNSDEIYERVSSILANYEQAKVLGQKGKIMVREKFSAEGLARNTAELYQKLVKKHE
ncbi:MAG: glycosyltransferase family 4 protein [Candidatus Marinimicrobia bacterium]|nr:glycosyltransferase family 4 protein [Candidatus Neomarinimicrobiota bacterium]